MKKPLPAIGNGLRFILCVAAAALFVLLSASTRTRIVRVDLVTLTAYSSRSFLFLVKLCSCLSGKDLRPLRKLIEPGSLSFYHIVVKLFRIDLNLNNGILCHCVDRVLISL